MEHRRRGADFSYSIQSFCGNTTDRGSAVDSVAQEQSSSSRTNVATTSDYDGDARMNSNRNDASGSSSVGSSSFKSTILAGQAAKSDSERTSESSYRTARSPNPSDGVTSTDGSWSSRRRFQAPGELNRAISRNFDPQPELDLSQTATDSRTSGEMNRNVFGYSGKSSHCSRDTNHNLKCGADEELPSESDANKRRPKTRSPKQHFRVSTPKPCNEPHRDAWSVLSSLDNVLDPCGDKTAKTKRTILRRLSQEFLYSPRTFTERLVTIIDESETGYPGDDASGVDLSRVTKEFRKMCKYIQDESMPEMAPSLCTTSVLGTSNYHDTNKTVNPIRPSTIPESPIPNFHPNETPPSFHNLNEKKIYRKTPLNIFKNTFRENKTTPTSFGTPNSTREFEYWEKYCEDLPDSPLSSTKNNSKPLRRSLSNPEIPKSSNENLMLKCEQMLRSLDDTDRQDFETFDSHRGPDDPNDADNSVANDVEVYEDQLSNSLMIEKELQRKRCFETALLMRKIEDEAKMTNEEYPKALERRGIDPGTAFLKTISTCMSYHNCINGIKKTNNLTSKKCSRVDSAIHSKSFGRTLYATSKKSFNQARSKNVEKNTNDQTSTMGNVKCVSTSSSTRTKTVGSATGAIKKIVRKAVSTGNLAQGQKQNLEKPSPRRNPILLRPPSKSNSRVKSPSTDKPIIRTSSKSRNFATLETKKKNPQSNGKTLIPSVMVEPATPTTPACRSTIRATSSERKTAISQRKNATKSISPGVKSPRCNYPLGTTLGMSWKNNVLTTTSQRAKSPITKSSSSTPKPSTSVRNSDDKRVEAKVDRLNPENIENSPMPTRNKNKTPRARLFVTPGRNSPAKQTRKKKGAYFPSMDDDINNQRSQLILKSLHAPGLYRLGYETVISPVSMYIRGTDVNLIHNNHERKNEFMLTPEKNLASEEKLKFSLAAKKSGMRDSPRRRDRRLDDGEDFESDDNNGKTEEPGFALPSADYNQPAQVHEVIASPKAIAGSRTRGLLDAMQSRVIIRHEAKIHDTKYDEKMVPESFGDGPADMSIHVLKSAEKTNFMKRRMFE